ncbi:hypothetical protein BU24DRAFT_73590 [Aaosphaeria arxii CBS 175.79]|uniref:Rhodopsin domain-containing protein n=1 Tax=Aaosphaeria arxii CBS 175.79 TaxID=1450172 RepID=A0A6A5XBF4_9PLEO|nr:uncharacterized protein BU24DRAFT_73590 [Aaosphaeria arxii CBS 175.79]KAF2010250.1 hypothetical protein BU24DRAFT_73590 [Aaosphaeria arxii CBS 175.79]
MANVSETVTMIPPPKGYVVDFENPQRQYKTESYIVCSVEMVLAFLFLAQRLYTKIFLMKKFQIEDAVVIIAWLFCMGTQICLLLGISAGAIGAHAWEISIDLYGYFSRVILAAPLLYAIGTAAAKCALSLFYRRLSPNQWFQAAVWFTLFVSVGAYTGLFFALLFACKPIAASWDPLLLPTAVCVNRGAIYITQAVLGIVTDCLLIALPIPTVLKLQMSTQLKLGLVAFFAVGIVTIVTSIIRLIILLPSLTTMDQTWVIGEGCLWIFIEANLLIMCCCLPTIRRFLRHVAPSLIGESSSGSDSKSNSNGYSRNGGLRTFGSGGAKRTFDSLMNTVDERGIPLNSLDEVHNMEKGGGTSTNAKSVTRDSDSEEAILYERSVQVTYESRQEGNTGDNDLGRLGNGWTMPSADDRHSQNKNI